MHIKRTALAGCAIAGSVPSSGLLPWEEAAIHCIPEGELAAWMMELGRTVVEHRGRFWTAKRRGLYQPVHPLAALRADEATAPAWACWGFRTRLSAPDAAAANGTMPVHLLREPGGYNWARLSPDRRRKIRRAFETIEVVALARADILLDQGYDIARGAQLLTPGVDVPNAAMFRRWVNSHFAPRRGLILAGLRRGQLLGFCSLWSVEGATYQDKLFVGSEGRARNLVLCLFHASATIARQHAQTRELMNGFHLRESPGLCAFKRGLGLEVVHLPTRTWLAPLAEPLLRRLRPDACYRFTGRA